MRPQKATIVTTLALCFVTLAACGGGGGGSGSNTPPTGTPPTGTPTPPRNNGVSLGLDVSELSFAAANASAATPPAQQVLAYVDNYKGNLQGDIFFS